MPEYVAEVAYVHAQDDIDWIDVAAVDRAEAIVYARLQFNRSAWGRLRDVQIQSVTVHEVERRYSLSLDSDAVDLDIREVPA